jgi:hypothetical protein
MSSRTWLGPVLVLVLLLAGSALAPSAAPPDPKQTPWKLAEAKLDAAIAACRAVAREYQEGNATYEQVALWSRRWREAQRDVKPKRADQLTAFEEHAKRMADLEKAARDRFSQRRGPASEVSATEYLRIEAEIEFSRYKGSK